MAAAVTPPGDVTVFALMSTSKARPVNVPESGQVPVDSREVEWRGYLQQICARDSRGLHALYDETSSVVYGVALTILRNDADAEEITSDVYIQVWRTAENFDAGRGSVHSWLMTLVRSRAIDRLRARTRKAEAMQSAAQIRPDVETPEQASWLGQRRGRIQKALQLLSPEQREAVELAYFSGLTQAELADRLQQPLGTVKTRIRLAMIKLREHLQSAREVLR